MDIDTLSAEANEAYVDEEYETALRLYTEAISQATDNAKLYLKRSITYQKLNQLTEAEADSSRAVALAPDNVVAYVRHGTVLLKLKRHQEAISVCEKGLSMSENSKQLQQLLQQCKDSAPADQSSEAATSHTEQQPMETEAGGTEVKDEAAEFKDEAAEFKDEAAEFKDKGERPVEAVPMPQPKVKHDFYQTETHVIVTILLRKVNSEDLRMDVTPSTLSVTVTREGGSCYSLELDLAHEVLPQQCTSRVTPAKIELKLRKKEAIHWKTLEGDGTIASATTASAAPPSAESQVHNYPSSRHTHKDWDKMAAEIKDEDEGDPLNGMFQKIYKDASEDTRRAMIKSFTESGGTVLSTNWDEIGAKKTEVKPPDGMEYKKYEM